MKKLSEKINYQSLLLSVTCNINLSSSDTCLARKNFCFLLDCGQLSVGGQSAENLGFLLAPVPLCELCLICQQEIHSVTVLHAILYTGVLQSITLFCLWCDNRQLNSTEVKLIITGFLVCEKQCLKVEA